MTLPISHRDRPLLTGNSLSLSLWGTSRKELFVPRLHWLRGPGGSATRMGISFPGSFISPPQIGCISQIQERPSPHPGIPRAFEERSAPYSGKFDVRHSSNYVRHSSHSSHCLVSAITSHSLAHNARRRLACFIVLLRMHAVV